MVEVRLPNGSSKQIEIYKQGRKGICPIDIRDILVRDFLLIRN